MNLLQAKFEIKQMVEKEASGYLSGEQLLSESLRIIESIMRFNIPIHGDLYHYLDDVDIRMKDKSYARSQIQKTLEILNEI